MLFLDQFNNTDMYRIDFIGPFNSQHGWLIAPIQLATTSSWSAMSDMQNMGGFAQAAQHAIGRSTLITIFTRQMWMGSEMVQFTFEVGYVALRNSFDEVVKPIRELLKFPLPPTLEDPLVPPANAMLSSADRFTIKSKYFEIPDLLPVNVQPQFSKVMAEDGHPVSGTCSLTFQSHQIVSQEVLNSWWLDNSPSYNAG